MEKPDTIALFIILQNVFISWKIVEISYTHFYHNFSKIYT